MNETRSLLSVVSLSLPFLLSFFLSPLSLFVYLLVYLIKLCMYPTLGILTALHPSTACMGIYILILLRIYDTICTLTISSREQHLGTLARRTLVIARMMICTLIPIIIVNSNYPQIHYIPFPLFCGGILKFQ